MEQYGTIWAIVENGGMIVGMMYIGPLLFALFFALMSDTVRGKTADTIIAVSRWIDVYQPMSYVVVGVFVGAPLLSFLLIHRWPKPEDEESALIRYRREHPDMME